MSHRTTYFLALVALTLMVASGMIASGCGSEKSKGTPASEEFRAELDSKISPLIRKVYDIDEDVEIRVEDVSQSAVPGLMKGIIKFRIEDSTESEAFMVSADGKHLLVEGFVHWRLDVPYEDQLRARYAEVMATIVITPDRVKGKVGAPVTIVEYSDFQCPYCKLGSRMLFGEVLGSYEGSVSFVYKHFPLGFHGWAQPAAVAAECARLQKPAAFWEFHDKLFEEQEALTAENVRAKSLAYAGQLGLAVEEFTACYDEKKTLPVVKGDIEEASRLGVESTPTFIINGRSVEGAVPASYLKEIIDEFLAGGSSEATS